MEPLMQFTSHIAGKNARVSLYPDRLEWDRKGFMSTSAKLTTGVLTAGTSFLATGFTGKKDTEMIPIKAVTSVTSTKKITNTIVSVIAAGNTIDFKISHAEAKQLKATLLRLINEPANPTTAAPDITAQLGRLAQLRDQGVLTVQEFEAKKAEMLKRI